MSEIKNTEDLRKFLLQSMTKVETGAMTTYEARAISNLTQQVYNTLRAEIDAANFQLRAQGKNVALTPVNLIQG